MEKSEQKLLTTRNLVRISILSAIAFALTYIKVPTFGFFPYFLSLEISDVPAVIGGIILGPVAGIVIQAVKNLIDLIIKPVGLGIGQLANFVIGSTYIFTLCYVYKRKKTNMGFFTGAVISISLMTIVACLTNYYFLFPIYTKIMADLTIDDLVNATKAVNPLVSDFKSLIYLSVAPFNLLKGVIETLLAFLLYKKINDVISSKP